MQQLARAGLLLLCSAIPLAAQPSSSTGWLPVLQVRAISSSPEGATANASGTWTMASDGDPLAMTFWTGPTLCSVGTAHGIDPASDGGARRTIWTITGAYLGDRQGRHQLRVTTRFVRLAGSEPGPATTQTLSLREGDAVTLDAVTAPTAGPCKVHAVTFDARVVMQPSAPALARQAYTADLWLVHDGPFNAETRDHLTFNVDGTTAMSFLFNRITFALPLLDARQGDIRAAITLSGSIRTRTRSDGLVDVDLETNRLVYGVTVPAGVSPLSSTLRKTIAVKPGETTAVEFPPPTSGVASMRLNSSASGDEQVHVGAAARGTQPDPREAVQIVDGRLVVDTARFFRGHRTRLLITLEPLP